MFQRFDPKRKQSPIKYFQSKSNLKFTFVAASTKAFGFREIKFAITFIPDPDILTTPFPIFVHSEMMKYLLSDVLYNSLNRNF